MPAMPTISLLHFGLGRLLGPLSEKELRIASRRVRSYALRSSYIVLLCLLMLSAWYSIVGMPDSVMKSLGISRASVVSTHVAVQVLVFQFAAAQLLAAVMLCSSLGDEMRRGTLGVLLTTPITSLHIVAGKLVGGLLQIVLLLAISLPVLAVLRSLGGLSWNDVSAGFCVILSAAVFAGALSLLLSTYFPHPSRAISAGAVIYLILFVGLPFAATGLLHLVGRNPPLLGSLLDLLNPFRAIYRTLPWLGRPPTAGAGSLFSWPVHCLILVGLACAACCTAVWRVRRVAAGDLFVKDRESGFVRRLWAAPAAWKEESGNLRHWRNTLLMAAATLVICTLIVIAKSTRRGRSVTIFPYYGLAGLWLVAFLRLALSTAGSITREKESGAWPVLLTTPLSETQILRGKVVAALRRNGVLLLSLLAIQACLMWHSDIPGRGVIVALYALQRVASIGFIVGAGLYFGTRLRTTTVAVASTMAAFLGVNYVIAGQFNPLFPLLWRWIVPVVSTWGNYSQVCFMALTTGPMIVVVAVLGLWMLRRARRNVREYVF